MRFFAFRAAREEFGVVASILKRLHSLKYSDIMMINDIIRYYQINIYPTFLSYFTRI